MLNELNERLLAQLIETPSVPGQEARLQAILREQLGSLTDSVQSDRLGNVIGTKHGRDDIRVMITAHLDEIGFVVKHIDERGFIRVLPLGWWDPANMISQRVIVTTASGATLHGALQPAWEPQQTMTLIERKMPAHHEFFVDLGMPAKAVKQSVRLGDTVTMDRTLERVGDCYMAKAMDDRIALLVMLEALRTMRTHAATIYAVATVQEEVGCRGAAAAAASLSPTVALALEVVNARDVPGVTPEDAVTTLGGGAAIKILDAMCISHPKLVEHLCAIAERNGIPYQLELKATGGTDASRIQPLHGGIPVVSLSVPTRYVHTPNEMVNAADVQACITLLARYLEEAHTETYDL